MTEDSWASSWGGGGDDVGDEVVSYSAVHLVVSFVLVVESWYGDARGGFGWLHWLRPSSDLRGSS